MVTTAHRSCGILLHPTCLPGPYGIGGLGQFAREFVDFLHASGQTYWQVLPVGPTGYGNSPYACLSPFAGNPNLIDLHELVADGLLHRDALDGWSAASDRTGRVDYGAAMAFKMPRLGEVARRFSSVASASLREQFDEFCHHNAAWLEDYALFRAAKQLQHQASLCEWPEPLRCREPAAVEALRTTCSELVHQHRVLQFLFFRQWGALRAYCRSKNVKIIGDMPIFVAFDSDAVWSNPRLFKLDCHLVASVVAGVPPDYFSELGQLWGNPLYDWKYHEEHGFRWWIDRLKMGLQLADVLRLDHFRGFEAAWEVPTHHRDARQGAWVKGPGHRLFDAIRREFGSVPLIAEDLGVITDEVNALRLAYDLPGMHVLQFGFPTTGERTYAPHRAQPNMIVYTGTHDNDTTVGWFKALPTDEREVVETYLHTSETSIHWDMIRAAYATVSHTVIVPMQDVLGLGSEARMNLPGTVEHCWEFRLRELPCARVSEKLACLTELFERSCPE